MKRDVIAWAAAVVLPASFALANCGACGPVGVEKDVETAGQQAAAIQTAGETRGCCQAAAVKEAQGQSISTAGLRELIGSSKPVVILDARSGKFDDGKRIPGAKALNAESPEKEVAALVPDRNAAIVTYCAGIKCPASHLLAERLKKMGYANVTEYPEGIAGWLAAGNAVEDAK